MAKDVVMYTCRECEESKKLGTNFKYLKSVQTITGDFATIQEWSKTLCSPCGVNKVS